MNLDPASEVRLLPWLSSALALVLSVVFAWMSVRHPRALGLRAWAAAWFCVSLANAGFALRGIVPDFVSIIVANLLLQIGLLACLAGALRLNSAQPRRVDAPGWALVAVTISLLIWFTYQVPDLRVRILIVCICTALLSSRVALQLSDFALHRGNSLPAGILAGLWWLLTVIMLITAAATWVYNVNTQNMYQSSPAVHVLFQVRPVLASLIAVFCLWVQLLALKTESTDYLARNQERVDASRIAFDQRCNEALSMQDAQPLSVALIDLDNFQVIAKLHGYAAADAVVQWVGEVVRNHLRPGDILDVYSHDQYALLLPATGKADARLMLEDVRRHIQRGNCMHEGQPLTTTVSIGLATSQADRNTARAMLSAARVAMYQARGEGRNRVATAHDNTPDITPSRTGR